MRKTYIKNFDALRAIAFLCVFVSHMFVNAEGTFVDGVFIRVLVKLGLLALIFSLFCLGF